MNRLCVRAAACVLAAALVGCGGPEDALAPPAPPSDGGDGAPVQVGPLVVRPASAAGFTALEIPTGGPVSLVALYGSQINYLGSLALLDRIVYVHGDYGQGQLYVCNLDGSNRVRLTNNTADDGWPEWSPDGGTVAFSRERPGEDREICLIKADGSGALALTANTDEDDSPTWSPEGRRIAFTSDRTGNREIFVMYADGSGAINLTNHAADDQTPGWSPYISDPEIAFASDRAGGDALIWVMHEDGSNPTNLTPTAPLALHPAFDRWGYQIAYMQSVAGRWDIFVMDSSGSPPHNLSAMPDHQQWPSWSSDGRFVCYASDTDGDYELVLQQAEEPWAAWTLTSNSVPDGYPSLGSPTMQTDRVLIGPAGSDWGGTNPIWSNAYAAVAAYAEDGYRNLARVGVSAANAHTIEISPLASTAQPMSGPTGVVVEAADIVNIREDGGRGRPTILWQLDPLDATAVALYFHWYTGKLLAVMVIADQNYPAAAGDAGSAVTQRTEGDAAVVQGSFGPVFDATGKCIADAAAVVRITGDRVDVVR